MSKSEMPIEGSAWIDDAQEGGLTRALTGECCWVDGSNYNPSFSLPIPFALRFDRSWKMHKEW